MAKYRGSKNNHNHATQARTKPNGRSGLVRAVSEGNVGDLWEKKIRDLEHKGRQGLYIAGACLVEKALNGGPVEYVSETLLRAQKDFLRVIQLEIQPVSDREGARARIHGAQMPDYGPIAALGELPSTTVAQKAYASSLSIGEELADRFRQENTERGNKEARDQLRNALGTLSVILLGQRHSIQTGDTGHMFPIMAGYSSLVHDVDFLTQTDTEIASIPVEVYLKCPTHPTHPDVHYLSLLDDLNVPGSPTYVDTIMRECLEDSGKASSRLDHRTELLFRHLELQ